MALLAIGKYTFEIKLIPMQRKSGMETKTSLLKLKNGHLSPALLCLLGFSNKIASWANSRCLLLNYGD